MKYDLKGIEFKYVHLELENEVFLTAFGFEDFTNRKSNLRIRKMQEFTLQFVEFGEGVFQLNNELFNLKKGDLFFIPKNEPIMYKKNPENPYKYYWLSINGNNAKNFINNIGLGNKNPVLNIEMYDDIISLFHQLHPLTNQTSIEIKYIVFGILNIIQKSTNTAKNQINNITNNSLWKDIADFIEINLPQSTLSIDLISEIFHINKVTLYRLCVSNTGVSTKAYILKRRIEKAKTLLEQQNSITTVSSKCGFADIFYFSKFFKEQVGISPTKYKRENIKIKE